MLKERLLLQVCVRVARLRDPGRSGARNNLDEYYLAAWGAMDDETREIETKWFSLARVDWILPAYTSIESIHLGLLSRLTISVGRTLYSCVASSSLLAQRACALFQLCHEEFDLGCARSSTPASGTQTFLGQGKVVIAALYQAVKRS